MHYTSLKLYGNEYWKLGYYEGVKTEDWVEYCEKGFGHGEKDPNWKYVPEKETKWKLLNGDPHPNVDYATAEILSRGFVWAIVAPPHIQKKLKEQGFM